MSKPVTRPNTKMGHRFFLSAKPRVSHTQQTAGPQRNQRIDLLSASRLMSHSLQSGRVFECFESPRVKGRATRPAPRPFEPIGGGGETASERTERAIHARACCSTCRELGSFACSDRPITRRRRWITSSRIMMHVIQMNTHTQAAAGTGRPFRVVPPPQQSRVITHTSSARPPP